MKAIETIEELVEKMKEKGFTKEFIDNFINDYEKFKDPNRKKSEEEIRIKKQTLEIFSYMKEVFPNIENDNAPFICSNKFYSCIENTILTMIYFHTAPKLFERKMYGENGWKYSEEYLEIFKKIIYFYRTEIYDKIPE